MTKMPWVRFFASDWLAGTRGMSAAETGVYITLIATMYERQEPIPEDHSRLARLCGASNSVFKNALELLIDDEKIIRVDGGLWNNRVEKERVYLSEKSEVGTKAAIARWGKKHNKNNGNQMRTQCEGNAKAMPFQIPDTIIEKNSLTVVQKETKKNAGLEDFKAVLSPVMRADILDDLIKHRRMKKAALSATAAKMVLAAADKCRMTPDKAAVTMIERNWITIKPEWINKNQQQQTTVSGLAGQMVRERYENENQRCETERPDLFSGDNPERFDINVLITGSKAP